MSEHVKLKNIKVIFHYLLLVLLFSTLSACAQQRRAPHFEWAECPDCPFPKAKIAYLKKENMHYGYLYVSENRQKKDSRILRLAVAVIKADSGKAVLPPVVFVHGGPGGASLGDVNNVFRSLRQERDVILLDQRGCGQSEPASCPELSQQFLTLLAKDLTPEEEIRERVKLAGSCKDQLQNEEIESASYNTNEIAADFEDLRKLLGYPSWNIWGVSYGTRVALKMMQLYPDGIHSVVLDSPIPAEALYFQENTDNFVRSLQLLFNKCAADSACRLVYPQLDKTFFEVMAALDKTPMVIPLDNDIPALKEHFVLNKQDFLLGLQQALYTKELYPYIPIVINAVKAGNTVIMKEFIKTMARRFFIMRYGMYYNVICSECIPYNNKAILDKSSDRWWKGLTFYRAEFDICNSWTPQKKQIPLSPTVTSTIPTLILCGEMDPIASPAYGRMVQKKLSHSFYYEFENEGHWITNTSYAIDIMKKFMNAPGVRPESNDTLMLNTIHFLTNVDELATLKSLKAIIYY